MSIGSNSLSRAMSPPPMGGDSARSVFSKYG
jgi:hypothetical protein